MTLEEPRQLIAADEGEMVEVTESTDLRSEMVRAHVV